MSANTAELNRMVTSLEMSGSYRVLERFQLLGRYGEAGQQEDIRRVMFVATETTGLSLIEDSIFELGYLLAEVDTKTGAVLRTGGKYQAFEDPGKPLDPYVSELTGVKDEDVKGKVFDAARIAADIAKVDLVVSHSADFDRQFLEKRFPEFQDKWFACSGTDVNWLAYGSRLTSLKFLAYKVARVFFDGRRTLSMAELLVHVLAMEVPDVGCPMAELLNNSRTMLNRVWADGAPSEMAGVLKAAGYDYCTNAMPFDLKRTWFRETTNVQEEIDWLGSEVLPRGAVVTVDQVSGRERFTGRVKKRTQMKIGEATGSSAQRSTPNATPERRRAPLPM